MGELPSGTVTFLFTDIEGSTRLWERDRRAMATALARHDALLGAAVTAEGGQVFKTVGDAFCAAFARAPAALAAALGAQRALAAEPWAELGDRGPLRVRMALHTGTVEPHAGDYVGPPLNRVARLLATGYGGQVLLSGTTARLVRENLPTGATLRDLAKHRLRDLLEPEHIFQLVVSDLDDGFPPLKTLDRLPTNLPTQPTPLVGRERELADGVALLGRDDVRLITLSGVGGTGKTRLGLALAAETLPTFADGAFVVDLAPLTDPALVLPTIAATLGVREGSGYTLQDALHAFLDDKQLLLLLDNFEQVLAAAPVVADLLAASAGLKTLVTSRARLGLRGEYEVLVPPLPIPDPRRPPPLAELAQIPAVTLFVQRATAARHDFALSAANAPAVAAICARLDGLPLAIELAAARVKLLPPPAILPRLDRRLALLTGGARDLPERHRTLRATIAWSHDLLPPAEQTLFRRLSVFAGGFSLEAAEVIGSEGGAGPRPQEVRGYGFSLPSSSPSPPSVLDGIDALLNQSLLRATEGPDGDGRMTMLETLREFGLERLVEAGEEATTRQAHAAWYLALAEGARPHLAGPEQGTWLARLDAEHDNLRAALTTTIDDPGEVKLRLVGALWRFWHQRGHLSEGRRWLDQALAGDGAAAPTTAIQAEALNGSGVLANTQGDYTHAIAAHQTSLAARRRLGDDEGVATSLNNLGNVAEAQGDFARAVALYDESLVIRRQLGDLPGVAAALSNLALVAYDQGDYARVEQLAEESLAIRRGLGDQRSIARALINLGLVAYARGDYPRTVALQEESLVILRALDDQRGVANALNNLGLVAEEQGDLARAVALHEEGLAIERQLGDQRGIAASLNNLAAVVAEQGDFEGAAALHAESLGILRDLADKRSLVDSLEGIAAIAAATSRPEGATRLLGAAEALRDTLGIAATPDENARTERALTAARAQLSEPALAALLAMGRTLSVEHAAAEAQAVVQEVAGLRSPA